VETASSGGGCESASLKSWPNLRDLVALQVAVPARAGAASGRNMPMNTWFSFCERLVALIGKLRRGEHRVDRLDLDQDLAQRVDDRVSLVAWKYLPPPLLAMLKQQRGLRSRPARP
jgi:hypothetical protein